MKLRSIAAAALLFWFAGCQTWGLPWSEITGERYNHTIADRWQARIVAVGGNGVFEIPYRALPGTYRIGVESPRHDGFTGTMLDMTLNVEPCKRYYINAQFAGPVGPDWSPVVDYTESIAGCQVGG
jgi:hypothetical protein